MKLIYVVHTGFFAVLLCSSCKTTPSNSSKALDNTQPVVGAPNTPVFPPPPYPPEDGADLYNSGFAVSSFEYWPFKWKAGQDAVAAQNRKCIPPYPAMVNESPNSYGYDTNTHVGPGSPGRKCMDKAYVRLFEIHKNPPQSCKDLATAGGPTSFYMWVNDYTGAGASQSASCRPNGGLRNLWIYPKPPGHLIKWINEYIPSYQPNGLDRGIAQPDADGCVLRTAEELAAFCTEMIPVVRAAVAAGNGGN